MNVGGYPNQNMNIGINGPHARRSGSSKPKKKSQN